MPDGRWQVAGGRRQVAVGIEKGHQLLVACQE